MTRVKIEPGICGLNTKVEAVYDDEEMEVKLTVYSACKAVQAMMAELGDTFDPYEICLKKPGQGPMYEYASEHFPTHVSCPTIAGIIKCTEVGCGLALKKDASIRFLEEE